MAITVREKVESREKSGGTTTLHYHISGTPDDTEAIAALLAVAPLTHDGGIRETYPTLDPVWVDTIADDGEWDCAVRYSRPEASSSTTPPETGDSVFSFDTGGGTQHISQAKSHVACHVPSGGTIEDFKGAIGVSGDGENITVEGVDITVPIYNFSETHYLPDSTVTEEYRNKLAALTGKVCGEAGFRGFDYYEVLFMGASGSRRGEGDWEITFRFAVSRTKENFTVGDITVPKKCGWDYMWIRYATEKGVKCYVKRPIQVCIEEVYDAGDFADLGIGT